MYDVVVVYPMMVGEEGEEVLLGQKQYGLGAGRWVGPGGKVEAGESILEAALRELAEEVGLIAVEDDLEAIATIDYPFPSRTQLSQRSHAFRLTRFEGVAVPSAELVPRWWSLDRLPVERMWPDAKLWLPSALRGHYHRGTLTIGDQDEVLSAEWS